MSSPAENRPLIAGAGPVGTAAALFLARDGVAVRLIEKAAKRREHSRALVVNPRTLTLLEPTGVTGQMLAMGKKIYGMRFWSGSRGLGRIGTEQLPGKYPFLLALSQSVSERLLEAALVAAGGAVERNWEIADCRAAAGGVSVELKSTLEHQDFQKTTVPWLLGADGAHSQVRTALDLSFPGSTFARQWYLVDAPLQTPLDEDHAHIIFLPGGRFLFCVRVIEDPTPPGKPIWRIMGNFRDPEQAVPDTAPTGPSVWTSAFRIDHRIVDRMQQGMMFVAGDAAHVHSPVGARGMNLGIEDAWVFARLAATGRLAEFNKLRRKVDRSVVRRVSTIARIAKGESALSRLTRRWVLPTALLAPPVRKQMLATVTGLDHPLPVV